MSTNVAKGQELIEWDFDKMKIRKINADGVEEIFDMSDPEVAGKVWENYKFYQKNYKGGDGRGNEIMAKSLVALDKGSKNYDALKQGRAIEQQLEGKMGLPVAAAAEGEEIYGSIIRDAPDTSGLKTDTAYSDSDGYSYEFLPSGDVKILTSKHGGTGKIVGKNSKYYGAIIDAMKSTKGVRPISKLDSVVASSFNDTELDDNDSKDPTKHHLDYRFQSANIKRRGEN